LYFMRARYYDPTLGRFLGEDPKWNTNLFLYTADNPINNIDPFGTDYLHPLQAANNWIGQFGTAAEYSRLNTSIGVNSNIFKISQNGWPGNRYIGMTKITKLGKLIGTTTTFAGLATDYIGLYNYYQNGPNSPNSMAPDEAASDALISGITYFGGPVGALFGLTHFTIDHLYPGGFNGYSKSVMNLLNKGFDKLFNW
jgi:hypothetical protein